MRKEKGVVSRKTLPYRAGILFKLYFMELIKIIDRQSGKKAVSARDLHRFLESRQDFTNWIKGRIEKYGLILNTDYILEVWDISLNKIIEFDLQRVTSPIRTEYILSMEAAKELSMVEGNEKGKEARRYFIECEKQLKDVKQLPEQLSRKQLALMVIEAEEEIERKDAEIKELTPKAEIHDLLVQSNDCVSMANASKILKLPYGRNTFIKNLRNARILDENNIAYQRYIDSGFFKIFESVKIIRGESKTFVCTKFTQKGISWIAKRVLFQKNVCKEINDKNKLQQII